MKSFKYDNYHKDGSRNGKGLLEEVSRGEEDYHVGWMLLRVAAEEGAERLELINRRGKGELQFLLLLLLVVVVLRSVRFVKKKKSKEKDENE